MLHDLNDGDFKYLQRTQKNEPYILYLLPVDSEHRTFTISPPPPPPPPPSTSTSDHNLKRMGIPDTHADFKQWMHTMKMVARLPGGMPAEFRRKVYILIVKLCFCKWIITHILLKLKQLWLALSDRYLQTKGINWDEEGEKYLGEQWDEDDEELGIQIVKVRIS